MKKFTLPLILFVVTILAFSALPVSAQTPFTCDIKNETRKAGGFFKNASSCCIVIGECSAEDFAKVAFEIARIVFAAAGVAALIFFIVGGIFMLVSGGNQTYIARGKLILRSAVIGIVIIFLSWIIVNLIVVAITGDPTGTLFNNSDWDVLRTSTR